MILQCEEQRDSLIVNGKAKVMNKICRCAIAIGLGLTIVSPVLLAQVPAEQTTVATSAPAIPPDQQPTNEQLTKLFEVMRLKEQMQNVLKMMPAMMQQQVLAQIKEMSSKLSGGSAPPPEFQAALEKMLNKYMKKAMEMYNVDEMLIDVGAIYKRHLSRSDVDGLMAFYSSPAGQHLLNEQPKIMQEYTPIVMKRVQERSKVLMDEMAQDMDEFIKPAASSTSKPDQK